MAKQMIAQQSHQRSFFIANFAKVKLAFDFLVLCRIQKICFLEERVCVTRFVESLKFICIMIDKLIECVIPFNQGHFIPFKVMK
jgi:hypothetical protein